MQQVSFQNTHTQGCNLSEGGILSWCDSRHRNGHTVTVCAHEYANYMPSTTNQRTGDQCLLILIQCKTDAHHQPGNRGKASCRRETEGGIKSRGRGKGSVCLSCLYLAMVRPPCCDKVGIKKWPWTPEEDIILVSYIQEHGPGNWRSVPTNTGLLRCSKSCRLRWTNYLRLGIKHGNFTAHEEGMIIHLQALLGNRWATIALYLPQRTDNDIKNFWNTHLKKEINKFQTTAAGSYASSSDSSTTCGIESYL